MDRYYIPILEKYTFYLPYSILLRKNKTSADRSKDLRLGDFDFSVIMLKDSYLEKLVKL